MSFVHSKKSRVLADGSHLSGFLNSASSSAERQAEDSTVFGDDDRTYVGGEGDGSVSLAGLFDGDTDAIHDILKDLLETDAASTLTYAPGGLGVGEAVGMASILSTGYEPSTQVAGLVEVSMGAQASGGLVFGVALTALTTETATGDGTGHDSGSSSSNGGVAHLHVTAASGTDPTLDVKVQESPDGSSWADLVTFDQADDVGGQRSTVDGSVARHLRAIWTVGGTDPSFTFAVAFARR